MSLIYESNRSNYCVPLLGSFLEALCCRFVGQNWKDSLTIGALMNTELMG
jgi:hypothetical protein